MALKLQDFIDIHQFQMLQDRLNEIYSFPSAIIDNDGHILTATAWQDVCTQFHRRNSECEKECLKSDRYIADHLHEANPAVSYRCPHGLIDNAIPIIIEGVHYGNYFTGQFFLEPPDLDFFRAQAKKYGFDEAAYLKAVKRVPIWTQEQLNSYLSFIRGLIEVISGIGLKNIRETETRKRMQESEEQFHTILQTAMDGFWLADMQGRLLEVNETYSRMSGYSVQELLTMRIFDLVTAQSVDEIKAIVRKIVKKGEYRFETKHLRKDGSILDVEVSVQYRSAEGGRLVAFLRDITERKRIEHEMAVIAEISRIVSSTLNIEEVYDAFTEQVKRILTFDRIVISIICPGGNATRNVYIAGEGLLDRNTEDTYPIEGSGHAEMLRTKSTLLIQTEDFLEYKDRFPRLWPTFQAGFRSIMNVPLFSKGEIIGALLLRSRKSLAYTERDVRLAESIGTQIAGTIFNAQLYSDLSKTEKSLRDSEERHRRILEALSDAVLLRSKEMVIYANPAAFKLFRANQPGDLIGKRYLDLVHPDDRAVSAERVKRNIDENRIVAPREHRILALDGQVVHVESTGVPFNYRGETQVFGVFRDITERKLAEDENRILTERLQRSEKMEVLGQMAGGVAHDLNNILGIMSGYSELLLEEIPKGSRSRGHVEKILQSTEKGAAIIQDLLTMTRRGVMTSEVINLNNVVSGFLKTPAFEKIRDYHTRVTFRSECDQTLLNIKGSPIHLEKTVLNLISNAAEAIPGKGEVTIRTESRYLDKPVRNYDEIKEGDYAVLTVSDTGTGIPAENMGKIFEPFYTKKTMGRSGTGLGLAIVWGTVKDHNGYIDVQTEVGRGTTFTLYFPVTRGERMAPQQKAQTDRYMGKGESVLVVDDVPEQRDVAARLIARLGYQVHVASSGEEAAEYLKTHTAELLVLDMIMTPGIDGLETYQKILEIRPKQKAILVSGFSETERVKKAQQLGAGAYVKKPYMLETIGMAIRDELNGKQMAP